MRPCTPMPGQLKQACLNLIINAIDAMPEGGCLTVRISREEDYTVIGIADTGEGIAPDMLDVFSRPL